ncbi:helix-turn-helix domain-containing protein [Streptomyces sp. NPDC087272]|uniref:helix-turn-helix domain-containing protein n=1 Tax=Streptomyces sp. NPDC087272 TaxID=3365775 RepID=UPI003809540C
MDGLNDALFKSLTKRSAKSEQRSVTMRAGQLLKRMGGSVKEAAAKVGSSPRTFKRWLSGESTPKAANSRSLNLANRDVLVPQGRRDRLERSANDEYLSYDEASDSWGVHRPEGIGMLGGGFVVDATIRVSRDVRRRSVNLGEYLSSGHMTELLNAFLSGNEAGAAGVVAEGFELWVPQAEVLEIHEISFGPLGYGG